ncbi:hypothetical protein JTE90_027701 [Oedothorax gibbosus]|uniref:Uncharacterized protein n=1 Tax=Oedothorax gibbosus TaxID=931172 RepID=A0AAV6UU31_9ARAC|nr:hypothetical protein JTE90_027701 [Oedothorax gibbosus]
MEEGKDLHTVLLDYRVTPSNGLKSPAELLMGRRLRSFIPCHTKTLQPHFDIQKEKIQLKENQRRQKKYADRGKKTLPDLHLQQPVLFRLKPEDPWLRAKVIKVGPQPRTYTVKADNGGTYVRNRFFLRPYNGPAQVVAEDVSSTVEDYYEDVLPVPPPAQVVPPAPPPAPSTSTTRSGRTVTVPTRYRTS